MVGILRLFILFAFICTLELIRITPEVSNYQVAFYIVAWTAIGFIVGFTMRKEQN